MLMTMDVTSGDGGSEKAIPRKDDNRIFHDVPISGIGQPILGYH
jgi:hypothetical protein